MDAIDAAPISGPSTTATSARRGWSTSPACRRSCACRSTRAGGTGARASGSGRSSAAIPARRSGATTSRSRRRGRSSSEHDIRHVPGANEELAATALSGTQMLDRYPHSRYDGVVGSGTGRAPASTGAATRSSTATSPAPAGTARWWSCRRGPRGEELDHALPGRLRVRRARHADPLPGLDGGVPHARPPRDRAVALQRLLGRDEAGRAARRRRRDGPRVARTSRGSWCRSS